MAVLMTGVAVAELSLPAPYNDLYGVYDKDGSESNGYHERWASGNCDARGAVFCYRRAGANLVDYEAGYLAVGARSTYPVSNHPSSGPRSFSLLFPVL